VTANVGARLVHELKEEVLDL